METSKPVVDEIIRALPARFQMPSARLLLGRSPMRVLVVLPVPDVSDSVRKRCAEHLAGGREIAVCHVLRGESGLSASLEAQRKITSALRRALESAAETIPVFVLTGGDGDAIEDCARAWGATDVQA
jgi:hypothetical protein